jgi:spore photoproduct lyase
MTPQQYNQKFNRIAEQTSYRLLNSEQQQFLKRQAIRFRFTLQELQLVSDMALDRLRWKEPAISDAWPERFSASAGDHCTITVKDKKNVLSGLKQQHDALRNDAKSYRNLTLEDKPRTEKPKLVAKVKSQLGLGRCPVASEKTRCCNLMTLDAVEKCGFDCSYCSIQSFYHGNEVTFDERFAEKLAQLKLDPSKTYHIGTGQSSDSLMWGNHKGVLEALSDFAQKNPNVILELKTKSKNIRWLQEHDYPANIICTWSLNPQSIIDHEEHLTANLDQRITAAQHIASKGRLVGFHFHPIVYYQDWIDDYRNICAEITSLFHPDSVALVSLGTLTFTRSVMKTIRNRPFTSKILQMPMEEIAGKFSYPLESKIEMFKTVYEALVPWHQEVFFYLCMEAQSLWRPVFGHEYETNVELESAMKTAYFKKIEGLRKPQQTQQV